MGCVSLEPGSSVCPGVVVRVENRFIVTNEPIEVTHRKLHGGDYTVVVEIPTRGQTYFARFPDGSPIIFSSYEGVVRTIGWINSNLGVGLTHLRVDVDSFAAQSWSYQQNNSDKTNTSKGDGESDQTKTVS